MKKLLPILFLLLWTAEVHATRYWAATTGSDANACNTIDGDTDPGVYRTISGAVTCATTSGDEVYIKAGTYTTSAIIDDPVSGVTVRGDSSTKANWPVIAPTSGYAIRFDLTRSNVTLKYLKLDMSGHSQPDACYIATSSSTTTNIILEDFECKGRVAGGTRNASGIKVFGPGKHTGMIIRRGKIYDWADDDSVGGPGAHGFYFQASNSTLEHLEITNYDGLCGQLYAGTPGTGINSNTLRYLYCHDRMAGSLQPGNLYIASGGLNIVHSSIFTNVQIGIAMRSIFGAVGTNKAYNNLIIPELSVSSSSTGITSSTTNCELINNIVLMADTAIGGTTCSTVTTNRTSGALGDIFLDAVNGNFSLKESSAAIDAGTAISGFSSGRYVGSAPDQGALEACIRSSAVVENATPTKYLVNYSCPSQSVRDGVGLQTPTVGNWDIVVASVPATESSAAIVGSAAVEITLGSAVTTGQSLTDAMTRSTAPTLMDNVCIGDPNTTCYNAQIRNHTAAAGTNNVGGGGGATYNIVHVRQFNWYSSVAAPTWKRLQDVAGGVQAGGRIALAVTIECTGADCDPTPYEWYFNTGAADALITDSVATNPVGFVNDAPSATDQAVISALLSGLTCPHATFVAGAIVGKQITQPSVDLSQNSCTTLIGLFQTKSDATGTINIKPKLPGGTAISYGVTPSFVIKAPEARQ